MSETDAIERLFGKLAAFSDSSKNSSHMQFSEQWFLELRETMAKAAATVASVREDRDRLEALVSELAQTDPIVDDDYCVFCLKLVDHPHDETCLWKRAKDTRG